MIVFFLQGAMIAIEVGAQGPNFGIVSACATGTHAIGEALKYLQASLFIFLLMELYSLY